MCEQDSCGVRDKLSNSDEVTLPDDHSLSDSDPEEAPASVPFDPEVIDLSDSDDEDDGLQICGAQEGPPSAPGQRVVPGATQNPFSLKGGSSSFSSRSRSIFDCLDSAAKLTSSQLGQDNVIDGVFARPPPPPPLTGNRKPGERAGQPPQSSREGGAGGQAGRGRGVPDYLVHPERWTCYSLEDVAETSDSQNSTVARQYIHSLQQRKKQETSGPEVEPFLPAFNQGQTNRSCNSSQHKIIFSRPDRADRHPGAVELKTGVGMERGKGLSHLEEEEEEKEEEEKDDDDDDDDDDDEEEEEEGMRLKAMDKEMDRSSEMKKAKEREDEGEEEEGRAAIKPPPAEQRKRKWGQQGRVEVEEEEERKSDKHQVNTGFVSFRKISRKNYRRTSEHEED